MITVDELISHLEGVEYVDISADEDGFALHLEAWDGSGVAIPIDGDTYQSLQQQFMEIDGQAKHCEKCSVDEARRSDND